MRQHYLWSSAQNHRTVLMYGILSQKLDVVKYLVDSWDANLHAKNKVRRSTLLPARLCTSDGNAFAALCLQKGNNIVVFVLDSGKIEMLQWWFDVSSTNATSRLDVRAGAIV